VKDLHKAVAALKEIKADLGRVPLRWEFVRISGIPEHRIDKLPGGYDALTRMAGLISPRKKRDTSWEREMKRYREAKDGFLVFEKEILPYSGRYDKKCQGDLTIMTMSDTHGHFVDLFAFEVFLDSVKRIQPDIIVLAGDIPDFYKISPFKKDPSRALSLQDEIDFIKNEMLRRIREAAPSAQIDWIWGNHEQWLFKYICGQAPALSSLDSLKFAKLFDLDALEINLIANPTFLTSDRRAGHAYGYKVYSNCLTITHGKSTAIHHAVNESRKYQMCGISGHDHNHQMFTWRVPDGLKWWDSMGSMCRNELAEDFVPDITKWNKSFSICHIHKGVPYPEPVLIIGGFAMVGGVRYTARDFGNSAESAQE